MHGDDDIATGDGDGGTDYDADENDDDDAGDDDDGNQYSEAGSERLHMRTHFPIQIILMATVKFPYKELALHCIHI